MEPDTLARPHSCPSCGAALRYDATWCSLCYHDLRPANPTPAYVGPDPLTAPLIDVVLPAIPAPAPAVDALGLPSVVPEAAAAKAAGTVAVWPCLRCGAHNAMTEQLCLECGAGFMSALQQRQSLELPVVGDLYAMSRAQRIGLALGALAVILVPLSLLMMLMSSPAKQDTVQQPVQTVTTAP